MKTKIIIIISSVLIFFLTEISYTGQLLEFKRSYNSSLIEPLSYISLAVACSMFIQLFVNKVIYERWLRLFYWYGSIATFLIFTGSVGVTYTWPSRVGLALFFSLCLVIGTLGFVLVQKFVYKR